MKTGTTVAIVVGAAAAAGVGLWLYLRSREDAEIDAYYGAATRAPATPIVRVAPPSAYSNPTRNLTPPQAASRSAAIARGRAAAYGTAPPSTRTEVTGTAVTTRGGAAVSRSGTAIAPTFTGLIPRRPVIVS